MIINAVIPAKGNSVRIKNKNLYEINGKSLIFLACEKLLECKNISNVYIDTECPGILSSVSSLLSRGLKVIDRPKQLADNQTGANEMMIYALHSVEECDLLLQTFCTSPTLTSDTIDKCIEKFINFGMPENDSFFTTIDVQEYFWKNNKPDNFSLKELPNSFELDVLKMETHGLYGITTESLIKNQTRIGKNPMMISVSKIESLDINVPEDLSIIKRILSDD